MKESVLVIGANGQIGSELVEALRKIYGNNNVVATDIKPATAELLHRGPFEQLDVLDFPKVRALISKYRVKQVYLLAALLSAVAEQKMKSAWRLNVESILGLLEIAKDEKLKAETRQARWLFVICYSTCTINNSLLTDHSRQARQKMLSPTVTVSPG